MTATSNRSRGLFIFLTVVLMAHGMDNNRCGSDIKGTFLNTAYEIVATTSAVSTENANSALIDAVVGGHSSDSYPYILLRSAHGRPEANIDLVFFNGKGVGLVVSACAKPVDGGFILQLRQKSAGEFGHVSEIHDINFQSSGPTSIMKVDLVTTRNHSELIFFKKTEIEKRRFELHSKSLSKEIMAKVLSLQTRLIEAP